MCSDNSCLCECCSVQIQILQERPSSIAVKPEFFFWVLFLTYYKLCKHSLHYASLNLCFLLEKGNFYYLMGHKEIAIQFIIVSLLV